MRHPMQQAFSSFGPDAATACGDVDGRHRVVAEIWASERDAREAGRARSAAALAIRRLSFPRGRWCGSPSQVGRAMSDAFVNQKAVRPLGCPTRRSGWPKVRPFLNGSFARHLPCGFSCSASMPTSNLLHRTSKARAVPGAIDGADRQGAAGKVEPFAVCRTVSPAGRLVSIGWLSTRSVAAARPSARWWGGSRHRRRCD